MSITRGSGLIAQIKCIVCMMIYIIAVISGLAAKTDVNVKIEVTPQVTTQSTKIEFEVTNNGLQAISEEIYVNKFEKIENGEWVELTFDDFINMSNAMYKVRFTDRFILPHETWYGSVSISGLFPDSEPTAGQYKITFGVKYTDNQENKVIYSTCEFTIEQA